MQDIFIPFVTILLAELFDKSQLSIILLSSKTKRVLPILFGAIIAFIIVDGVAIFLGATISRFIPVVLVHSFAAILFIWFGIKTLLDNETNDKTSEKSVASSPALVSTFSMIFLAEWGDKTQITSAGFGATYNPLLVFIGVILAMILLTISAIYAGKFLAKNVKRNLINKLTGVIFLTIGILLLVSLFI